MSYEAGPRNAYDAGYRERLRARAKEEDKDLFDGDPLDSLTHLLLMIDSHPEYARDTIAAEVDRLLQPLYSDNKSRVQMERFARLQELYQRSAVGVAKHNGVPMIH